MDIETQVVEMAVQARQAARKMASVSGGQKEKMLLLLAGLIKEQSGDIISLPGSSSTRTLGSSRSTHMMARRRRLWLKALSLLYLYNECF